MSISVLQKKKGRPATGVTPHLTMRMPADVAAAIAKAAAAEPDTPSRSELIRRIVVEWLKEKGHLE